MAKDEEVERDPFEAWARGDDIDDDDPFLVPKEKVHRPLTGPESLNLPLVDDKK